MATTTFFANRAQPRPRQDEEGCSKQPATITPTRNRRTRTAVKRRRREPATWRCDAWRAAPSKPPLGARRPRRAARSGASSRAERCTRDVPSVAATGRRLRHLSRRDGFEEETLALPFAHTVSWRRSREHKLRRRSAPLARFLLARASRSIRSGATKSAAAAATGGLWAGCGTGPPAASPRIRPDPLRHHGAAWRSCLDRGCANARSGKSRRAHTHTARA